MHRPAPVASLLAVAGTVLALVVTSGLPARAAVADGDPTVVAGGGQGYGGPATGVFLPSSNYLPTRVGIDRRDGSLLIADGYSRVVRVASAGGAAVVVAGTHTPGHSGDGGPATSAQLEWPTDVATDNAGNTYVAEAHHVRRVEPDGTIRNVAGDGSARSTATGVSATSTGVAPTALDVFPDGRVVIAEGSQVRVVSPTGTISLLTPAGSFGSVSDVAVAPDGAVIVGDGARHLVYRIAAGTSTATVVAGNGTQGGSSGDGIAATTAPIEWPRALAVAPDGTVYVTDTANGPRLRRFTIGGAITTAIDSSSSPYSCVGSVAVSGTGSGAVLCPAKDVDQSAQVLHFDGGVAGAVWAGAAPTATASPDGVSAREARLDDVAGSAVDGSGRTWLTGNGLVRYVDGAGAIRTASTPSAGPATPTRLAAAGVDSVYAADPGGNRVWRVTADGSAQVVAGNGAATYAGDGPSAVAVGLAAPNAVAVGPDGVLYVADTKAGAVRAVSTSGGIRTVFQGATTVLDVAVAGTTLAVATDGGLLTVDLPSGQVHRLTLRPFTTVTPDGSGGWYGDGVDGAVDLAPDGSVHVLTDLSTVTAIAQLSRTATGSLTVATGALVRAIAPAVSAAPQPPTGFTATPGSGRITLDWTSPASVELRMARGEVAPANVYDGDGVPGSGKPHVVFRDLAGPLPAGVDYSFAAFVHDYVTVAPYTVATVWSRAATATAAALPDTTPPAPVSDFTVDARADTIVLGWTNPTDDDLSPDRGVVVRMAQGTTPASTPSDGVDVALGADHHSAAPPAADLAADTDYSFSVFTIDLRGNYGPPTTVTARLDRTPPGQVTDLVATASYQSVSMTWTNPTDADFATTLVASGRGADTPPAPSTTCYRSASPGTAGGVGSLDMDTDYTVAVYSCDVHGNISAPAVAHVHTLLDAVPPGPVTGVTATGGDHGFSVAFTPPTDADYASTLVRYQEGTTPPATVTDGVAAAAYNTGNTRYAPNLPGGRTYAISLWARDAHGNYSEPVHLTVTTKPDTTPPPQPGFAQVSSPGSRLVYFCYSLPSMPTDLAGVHVDVSPLGVLPTSPNDHFVRDLTKAQGTCGSVPVADNEVHYSLSLWAYDTTGNVGLRGTADVVAHALASQVPSYVPDLAAVPADVDNAVDVSWGTPTSDGGSALAGYRVTAWWNGGSITRDTAADVHALRVTDVPGGIDLNVSVLAANGNGWNNITTSTAVRATDTTAPAPVVSGPSVTATAPGAATVSWGASSATDVAAYVVVRTTGTTAAAAPSSGVVVATTRATSAAVTGLANGVGYTFTVFPRDYAGHVGAGRAVRTTGTTLTVSAPTTIRYGSYVTFTGVLRAAGSTAGLPGRSVSLCGRKRGTTTWTCYARTTTSTTGTYRFSARPTSNWDYDVRYAGTGSQLGSNAGRTVYVAVVVSLRASRTVFYLGGSTLLSGSIAPAHAGAPVVLQRYYSRAWHTVTTVRSTSRSTFSFTVRPGARGSFPYRVYRAADGDHAAATSAAVSLAVR